MLNNIAGLQQDKQTSTQADKRSGHTPAFSRSPGLPVALSGRNWVKWLLIGIVVTYVAVLIVVPLVALINGAFAGGLGAIEAATGEVIEQRLVIELGVVAAQGKLEAVLAFGSAVTGAGGAAGLVEDGGDVTQEGDRIGGG